MEPERPRFDGLCTVHVEMPCSGATNCALAGYFDAAIRQPKQEVLTPAIQTWVEDAHGFVRLRIAELKPGELRTVAVPTCQRQVGQVVASAASTRHQVLDLKGAIEELLGCQAIVALMIGALGDVPVLSRRHARRTEPHGQR